MTIVNKRKSKKATCNELSGESEWELAFRAEAGNGRHVFVAWLDNTFTSPSDSGCQLLTKTNCPDHYRHPMLDQSTVDEFLASKEKVCWCVCLVLSINVGKTCEKYLDKPCSK